MTFQPSEQAGWFCESVRGNWQQGLRGTEGQRGRELVPLKSGSLQPPAKEPTVLVWVRIGL